MEIFAVIILDKDTLQEGYEIKRDREFKRERYIEVDIVDSAERERDIDI